MPITSITAQPVSGSLMAAYRPVVFIVEATSTQGTPQPPYVVCDIYLNDVYYKSIERTAPDSLGANSSVFLFDISDALQEYLAVDLAPVSNNNLLNAPHSSCKVLCRFRSSGVDSDGFTTEEGTRPTQATKFTAAVSGDGTASNQFFAINAALQHEDNQELAAHLNSFKQGTWDALAWPLTHRNNYFFCNDSSDHYPLIYSGPCTQTDICIHYRMRGSSVWQTACTASDPACDSLDYTVAVVGTRVNISLASAPPSGQQVQLTYKLSSDTVWSTPKYFTAQDFYVDVTTPGTYDIRIIRFCTCCTSGTPVQKSFTIVDNTANLAWRGINPFCVQASLPTTIYVKLQLRNATNNITYYPNNSSYTQKIVANTADLYAMFYSDAALLNPLTVNQNGLPVYVKRHDQTYDGTRYTNSDTVLPFSVNAAGTEVLLGNVTVGSQTSNYSITGGVSGPVETQTGETDVTSTFSAYPSAQLIGGNTGYQGYATLQQYDTTTSLATGVTKPNASTDPDYIAPTSDPASCPVGAPITQLLYGYGLAIDKVEFLQGATTLFAQTVADTGSGGNGETMYVPKNVDTYVSVKVRTLDTGNTTGVVQVRVQLDDGTNYQYSVRGGIETQLPQTFKSIRVVNISNY